MTATRTTNILLIILISIMLIVLVLQVWHMVDSNRPVIRPHIVPKATPKLPDAWYEKYRNEQGCNQLPEQRV